MSKQVRTVAIPDELVMDKIYLIREQKVMLDEDLAELYGVETRRLNEQVGRNIDRFPEDFMFRLNEEEFANLKSHFATSSWGGRRTPPYAFTEHGVLMLSSVLNSKQAIQVNIQIMRIYTRIRELLLTHKDILLLVEKVEKKLIKQDQKIEVLFTYLNKFIEKDETPRTSIGYKTYPKKE
ncbi:ORF6N domain-containing protein [Mucilaginibacter sp. McL0603]|uniref:ORF6N domain-containing protein n=1 Tax=Mucilaginibacter sp. McL0603 TaxID=3415670 RepID=UPI003CF4B3D8